jgi:putative Holliday junction resolvase
MRAKAYSRARHSQVLQVLLSKKWNKSFFLAANTNNIHVTKALPLRLTYYFKNLTFGFYFLNGAKRFTPNTQRLTIFMARILAFDYGTKRIGIAVTDPLQIIATGLDTVHPKDVIEYVKKYMISEQVEAFVLGDPKQMDGSPSDSAQHVKGFATLLKKSFPDIPRHWVDERFTSKLAHQAIMQSGLKKMDRRDKDRVDTIAATIILQYFMESNRL